MGVLVEVSFPIIPGAGLIKFELDDTMQYRRIPPFGPGLMDYIPLSGAWETDWGSRSINGRDGETLVELRDWDTAMGPALYQPSRQRAAGGMQSILGTWKCLPKPLPANGETGVWVGFAGKVSGGLVTSGVIGGDCIGGCVVSIDRPEAVVFTALDAHLGVDWGSSASLVGVLITGYKKPQDINCATRSGVDVAFSTGPAKAWIKEVCTVAQNAAVEANAGVQALKAEQMIAAVVTNSGALVRNFKNIINAANIDWERKKLTTFSGLISSAGLEVGIFYYVGIIRVITSFNPLFPVVLPSG